MEILLSAILRIKKKNMDNVFLRDWFASRQISVGNIKYQKTYSFLVTYQ